MVAGMIMQTMQLWTREELQKDSKAGELLLNEKHYPNDTP
jgi:hypothetical protein